MSYTVNVQALSPEPKPIPLASTCPESFKGLPFNQVIIQYGSDLIHCVYAKDGKVDHYDQTKKSEPFNMSSDGTAPIGGV